MNKNNETDMSDVVSMIDKMKAYTTSKLVHSHGMRQHLDMNSLVWHEPVLVQTTHNKNGNMIKKALVMMQWYLVESDLSKAGVSEVIFNNESDVIQFRTKRTREYIEGIFKECGFLVEVTCRLNIASYNEMSVKFKDKTEFFVMYNVLTGSSHTEQFLGSLGGLFGTGGKSEPRLTHRGLISFPMSSAIAQIELVSSIVEECSNQVASIVAGRSWEITNFNTINEQFEFSDTFNSFFAKRVGLIKSNKYYHSRQLSLLRNLLKIAGMKMTVELREIQPLVPDTPVAPDKPTDIDAIDAAFLAQMQTGLLPYNPLPLTKGTNNKLSNRVYDWRLASEPDTVSSKPDIEHEIVVTITCPKTNSKIKECWAVLNDSGATDGTKELMRHYLEECDVLSLDPGSYEGEMNVMEGELELQIIPDPATSSDRMSMWSIEQVENDDERTTVTTDGQGDSSENYIANEDCNCPE